MDNQNKDGDPDSRELYGLKISELLKTLAERKSPSFDPRNISTSLCTLKNTGTGSSNTNGTFRSRAVLPENINRLSKFRFKRRDHLRESLAASVPVAAQASSQEEQPSLPSSDPVIHPLLVEESQTLPSDSVCCTGEGLSEREMHHHILGVQVSTKHQSSEPRRTPPQQFHQTGPTSEWFFEDLTDLQVKLFLGASKKSGVRRNSQTAGKTTRHD
ncbi:uncharacterized protein LOC119493351 isoform X1 [Sebastes umbrosus]|uniref:uncharacterized protein LOC119493351 isoform X1 n=1 Tax=Sebastes umbrosus TaxID=72105 RepID=UPI00189E94C5|nr:uncharacterized protein LOC119493351 isoform X1 [Sebastes umbrosus]